MSKNHFSIERDGRCINNIVIRNDDSSVAFESVMNMSYDEIKSYDKVEEFVVCVMDVSNRTFGTHDNQTIVTLIGDDDVFIWSIIIGPDIDDQMRYVFVDWNKDGKNYRYEKK